MKKSILLAALLIPLAAHAQQIGGMVGEAAKHEIAVHNRSGTSPITGLYMTLNSYPGDNWLAGETWYDIKTIEPGASATFTLHCRTTPGVYISETVTIRIDWQDKETGETVQTEEWTDPCYSQDLYLTPQGLIYE